MLVTNAPLLVRSATLLETSAAVLVRSAAPLGMFFWGFGLVVLIHYLIER